MIYVHSMNTLDQEEEHEEKAGEAKGNRGTGVQLSNDRQELFPLH